MLSVKGRELFGLSFLGFTFPFSFEIISSLSRLVSRYYSPFGGSLYFKNLHFSVPSIIFQIPQRLEVVSVGTVYDVLKPHVAVYHRLYRVY